MSLHGKVFYLIYFFNSSLKNLPIDVITDIIEAFFKLLKLEKDKLSTHVFLCIEVKSNFNQFIIFRVYYRQRNWILKLLFRY